MIELSEQQRRIAVDAWGSAIENTNCHETESLYAACAAVLAASPQTQPDYDALYRAIVHQGNRAGLWKTFAQEVIKELASAPYEPSESATTRAIIAERDAEWESALRCQWDTPGHAGFDDYIAKLRARLSGSAYECPAAQATPAPEGRERGRAESELAALQQAWASKVGDGTDKITPGEIVSLIDDYQDKLAEGRTERDRLLAQVQPRWISVEESMPTEPDREFWCWVKANDGIEASGGTVVKADMKPRIRTVKTYLSKQGTVRFNCGCLEMVTHYMHQPAPPEPPHAS